MGLNSAHSNVGFIEGLSGLIYNLKPYSHLSLLESHALTEQVSGSIHLVFKLDIFVGVAKTQETFCFLDHFA